MINKKIPLCMIDHDLGELYTYLELFNKVYGGYESEAATILNGILEIYTEEYRVENADKALRELRNPRKAGRKSSITEEQKSEIKRLREAGKSIREISGETGVSRSSVQRLLDAARRRASRI